jgi:hypothetical protein
MAFTTFKTFLYFTTDMRTGRPKRIEIKVNEVIRNVISEIFEKYILKDVKGNLLLLGDHNKNDLSRDVSEDAIKFGVKLQKKEIATRLFKPYIDETPFVISVGYLGRISKYLINAAETYGYSPTHPALEQFKKIHLKNKSLIIDQEVTAVETIGKNSKAPLHWLDNTKWLLYERTGSEDERNSQWGIAIGSLALSLDKEALVAEFEFIHQSKTRVYKGRVHSDDLFWYLYFDLLLEESDGKRGTITLMIDVADRQEQTLYAGHFTYHSKDFGRLLSNAIIVENKHKDNQNLDIGNYYASEVSKYEMINEAIRRFLYSRDRNRLSLPKKPLSSLASLESFNEDKKKKLSKALAHLLGDYFVYYCTDAGAIREDELTIKHQSGYEHIEAIYIHRPDSKRKNKKSWTGQVFVNKDTIVIELSETPSADNRTDEDPILLTFHKPGEDITFDESQCFSGLLDGLQDSSRLPVCFLCLVTRKGIPKFKRNKDERIVNYFKAQKVTQLVPPITKFRLDDLLKEDSAIDTIEPPV